MSRIEIFSRELLLKYPSKFTEDIANTQNISINWTKSLSDTEKYRILKLNSERNTWNRKALELASHSLSVNDIDIVESTTVGFVNHQNLSESPPLYSRPTVTVEWDSDNLFPATTYYLEVENQLGSIVIELLLPVYGNSMRYDLVGIDRKIKRNPTNRNLAVVRESILSNLKEYMAENLIQMIDKK